MKYKSIRDVLIETRKITRGSTASAAGIALILLTAALLAVGQSNGTVDRAEITANGTFTSVASANIGQQTVIAHVVADRSQCVLGVPCPASLIPLEGKLVIIEGTGTGELEGICGGGSLKSLVPPDSGTEYHLTVRFGKDCRASN